jgi:hypothetical protein
MRRAAAAVHATLSLALFACTIGPAATDGGTASTTSAPPRSVRDQCEDVLTEYCQKAASCVLPVAGLKDCIDNALPLCCTGSQCDQPSPTPEAVVNECKQAIDSELCNDVAATTNPTTCLRSS